MLLVSRESLVESRESRVFRGVVSVALAMALRLMGAWLLLSRTLCRNPIMIEQPVVAPVILPGSVTIVLSPDMRVYSSMGSAPQTLGYYLFNIAADPGDPTIHFIAINGLTGTQVAAAAVMNVEDRNGTHGGIYSVELDASSQGGLADQPQTNKEMAYKIMDVIGSMHKPNVFMWTGDTLSTLQWEDTKGNVAYFCPVITGHADKIAMNGYYPVLSVEFVSTDGFSAVIRVQRTHDPCLDENGLYTIGASGAINMSWLEECSSGYADPADPMNADKILMTVGAGLHTLGVKANYVNGDGHGTYDCSSKRSMVIKVDF